MRRLLPLAASILLLGSSCGLGAIGILSSGGGGGGGNSPAAIGSLQLGADLLDARESPVEISFIVTDPESNPIGVELCVEELGSASCQAITLVGDPDLTHLQSSPTGVVHAFQWDYASQLASGQHYAGGIQITASVVGSASTVTIGPLALGNDPPGISGITVPVGEVSGTFQVDFVLADTSSDPISIDVEYSDADDLSTWLPATGLGPPLNNVASSSGGLTVPFVWDTPADIDGRELSAILRFTPRDATSQGAPSLSGTISIDNNESPTALVNGSAFVASPDRRRGIPLEVTTLDGEADNLRVILQWSRDDQPFPSLPTTRAELESMLQVPGWGASRQIATRLQTYVAGRVDPVDSLNIRVPGIAVGSSLLAPDGLTNREFELMRPITKLISPAGAWSSNPLLAPIAAIPTNDGARAIVLDRDSPGSWRLIEIDLAVGTITRTLVTSCPGIPTILARGTDGNDYLVADEASGAWTIHAINGESGTRLVIATGIAPVTPIRGIVSIGPSRALFTAADSLVDLDWSNPSLPTQTILATGLQAPWGLAADPQRSRHILLAERNWVNPTTSQPTGRILDYNLLTQTFTSINATSSALIRPQFIAFEANGTRLLATTDEITGDGTSELRGFEFRGGLGGPGFTVQSGIADLGPGLATGEPQVRLVALPALNGVLVSGGVQQRRTVSQFDPATSTISVSQAFLPALTVDLTWRCAIQQDLQSSNPSGIGHRFVWNSADIGLGANIVFRATPFDAEAGLATSTSIPRRVRSSIDASPFVVGGPGMTDGVVSVDVADLNGDGLLDLVSANRDLNTIATFLATAPGRYPPAPNQVLQGNILVPITAPTSVVALDFDGDGDRDLAVANAGSSNVALFRQNSPGSFALQLTALGGGIGGACDIAHADVNGDELEDIVVSARTNNSLAVYYQLVGGLFPLSPSATLSHAAMQQPVSVALADLNKDGLVDAVSANRASNNLTIFYRSSGGFTAPPVVLGGVGQTDEPLSVLVSDVNLDNREDLVCANHSGNDLTAFLQDSTGSFSQASSLALQASAGPVQPNAVEVVDLSGDGHPDIVSANGGNDLSAFIYRLEEAQFEGARLLDEEAGILSNPADLRAADLDGDGLQDLVLSNTGGDAVAVLLQRGAGHFSQIPDLSLGNGSETPGLSAIVAADLDHDGDLDIASANRDGETVAIFVQLGPAITAATPSTILGPSATMSGTCAIAAADLNGDERVDLAVAEQTAGNIAVFFQSALGTFSPVPEAVIGGGFLPGPVALTISDLDSDGREDIACVNQSGSTLSIFRRGIDGSLPTMPSITIGSPGTTPGPVDLTSADLDGDGDLDLVTANRTGNTLGVFFQGANGNFQLAPNITLGGAGATNGVCKVVAFDLEGDGDLDLACANSTANTIRIFPQANPGQFPAGASSILSDSMVINPQSLAAGDIDGDGDADLAVGCSGTNRLVVFRQTRPGVFGAIADAYGGLGSTDGPLSLSIVDFDGDGDADMLSAHPALERLSIFFGSH